MARLSPHIDEACARRLQELVRVACVPYNDHAYAGDDVVGLLECLGTWDRVQEL